MVEALGLLQRTYSKLTPGVTAELSVFSVCPASVGFITHINPDHQLTVHPPPYSSATLVMGKVLRVLRLRSFSPGILNKYFELRSLNVSHWGHIWWEKQIVMVKWYKVPAWDDQWADGLCVSLQKTSLRRESRTFSQKKNYKKRKKRN